MIVPVILLACHGRGAPGADSGERLFASTCARCHGLDGRGGEHGPNIATRSEVRRWSDAQLYRLVHDGRPQAGMPGFAFIGAEQVKAVVGWVRALQGRADTASAAGNAEKGRALFFGKAQCSACHSVAGQGGLLAPDLTAWAARSREVESIQDGTMHDGSARPVVVTTSDGRRWEGVARNEDNFSIQLQSPDGQFHFIDKKTVKSIRREAQDFGAALSAGERNDIAAFLLACAARQ